MSRPARILALFTLGLAADAAPGLGQPPATATPAPFRWDGCSVADANGTIRVVRCPTFELRVWRAPRLADAAGLAAIAATLPPAAGGVPGQLRAGTLTAPCWESGELLLSAPLPDVAAVCLEPSGPSREACRAGMVEMVRSRSLPPGVRFPEPQLRFLGAPLAVPEGCSMVGPERIACAATGSAFDWREQAAREADTAASVLAASAQVMRNLLTVVEETPMACSLRGVPGSGVRLRAQVSAQTVDLAICAVVRDGTKSIAQCIGNLPGGRPWPAPCAQVFDGAVP